MDDRPTPLTNAARLTMDERVRMLANEDDPLPEFVPAEFARQLERSNAELRNVLQDARGMVNYSAIGFTHAEWMTRNAQQILERIDTVLRNAGGSHE